MTMSSGGDYGAGESFTPLKDSGERYYNKITTNVLITAALSLVFIVVLAVLFKVYVRFLLRRQASRRGAAIALFHMGIQTSGPSPPSIVGLDPAVIATLPRYAYKSCAAGPDGVSPPPPECAVCLSTVEEGEMVKVMPNCKHTFHDECIDMWLHSHSTCPICRAGAAPATVVDAERVVSVAVEPSGDYGGGGGAPDGRGSCREDSSTSSAGRLGSSLRRMLSRERSSTTTHDDDLERQ